MSQTIGSIGTRIKLKDYNNPENVIWPQTDIESVVGLTDEINNIFEKFAEQKPINKLVKRKIYNSHNLRDGLISLHSIPGDIYKCHKLKIGIVRAGGILNVTKDQLQKVLRLENYNEVRLHVWPKGDQELYKDWIQAGREAQETFLWDENRDRYYLDASENDYDLTYKQCMVAWVPLSEEYDYYMMTPNGKIAPYPYIPTKNVLNVPTLAVDADNYRVYALTSKKNHVQIQQLCRHRKTSKYVEGERKLIKRLKIKRFVKGINLINDSIVDGYNQEHVVEKQWQNRKSWGNKTCKKLYFRARYNNWKYISNWGYWVVRLMNGRPPELIRL